MGLCLSSRIYAYFPNMSATFGIKTIYIFKIASILISRIVIPNFDTIFELVGSRQPLIGVTCTLLFLYRVINENMLEIKPKI